MKLGTLIEKQLKKAGIDTSTDDLKSILEIETDVPDEVANKMDRALLTVEAAKSNGAVIKAIKQSTLAGADTKLDELIAELGLQPNEDFLSNNNTYEKIAIVAKLANEAGKKANGATNKTTADEWTKKEADYNKQLKELKESVQKIESDYSTKEQSLLTNFELEKILLGKDYVFPKELDNNLKIQTALGAVNTELQKKGLSIKRNEAGQLVILNKDGQPAYSETNEALSPNTFIDGALAQNKLLKINDASQQHSTASTGAQPAFIPGNGNLDAIRTEFLNQATAIPA